MKVKTIKEKNVYVFIIAAGTLFLADALSDLEENGERKKKKSSVVRIKLKSLQEILPEHTSDLKSPQQVSKLLFQNEWPKEKAVTFLIDLAFCNPFAPYELKFKDNELREALQQLARNIGVSNEDVDSILETKKDALKVHRNLNWAMILIAGVSATAVLALGGWVAAPAIGTAIGSATGLSGAAATAHGLAILGGGSLALGGSGMAGGMWLVTGAGAAFGLLGGGGSTLLLQLGAAGAKLELTKLQVSYKEVVLNNQMQTKKAQEVIKNLGRDRDKILEQLKMEKELNDKNAKRLKEMEETVKAIEKAMDWMKKKKAI
jgi:hypothetical protein